MTDSADGPNVSINGPKDLLHGVGGTSDSKVKQEGMDHIKEKLGKRSTTDTASADGAQPLSTNPGSEDARGGISAGSGGVSSAAHVASPVGSGDDGVSQQQTTGGGLVETVKGYLGLGGGESEKSRGDDVAANDQTSTSGDPATKAVDAAAGSRTGTNPGSSEMASDNAGENKPNDGEQAHDGPRGDDSKGDSNQEGEKSKVEKKTGKQMENKDAIPTAGGEKLGEKHWGESKIVC
ncbi:hypothetical protein M433DRAFT_429038 [Acidomyces richmondensis BFW]|nr:hypothetical protein M433DRAFT_429038 [Acidomyces richmondensis BFW]